MQDRIIAFRPLGQGHILLTFADGETREVDLTPLIERGGLFAQLSDDAFLARARIEDNGYCLEWPGDIDFGADTLRARGTVVSSARRIA